MSSFSKSSKSIPSMREVVEVKYLSITLELKPKHSKSAEPL